MAEIRGKFITLTASLMGLYEKQLEEANNLIIKETGTPWKKLDPEGWHDIKYYNNFIDSYVSASPSREKAMITLGKKIYPTIKKTVGFPPNLNKIIDYVEFESQGYLENVRGDDVEPRNIIKNERGLIVLETHMKEQNCKTLEGVYLSMLALAGIENGSVVQKKCIKNGDPNCEFHISW